MSGNHLDLKEGDIDDLFDVFGGSREDDPSTGENPIVENEDPTKTQKLKGHFADIDTDEALAGLGIDEAKTPVTPINASKEADPTPAPIIYQDTQEFEIPGSADEEATKVVKAEEILAVLEQEGDLRRPKINSLPIIDDDKKTPEHDTDDNDTVLSVLNEQYKEELVEKMNTIKRILNSEISEDKLYAKLYPIFTGVIRDVLSIYKNHPDFAIEEFSNFLNSLKEILLKGELSIKIVKTVKDVLALTETTFKAVDKRGMNLDERRMLAANQIYDYEQIKRLRDHFVSFLETRIRDMETNSVETNFATESQDISYVLANVEKSLSNPIKVQSIIKKALKSINSGDFLSPEMNQMKRAINLSGSVNTDFQSPQIKQLKRMLLISGLVDIIFTYSNIFPSSTKRISEMIQEDSSFVDEEKDIPLYNLRIKHLDVLARKLDQIEIYVLNHYHSAHEAASNSEKIMNASSFRKKEVEIIDAISKTIEYQDMHSLRFEGLSLIYIKLRELYKKYGSDSFKDDVKKKMLEVLGMFKEEPVIATYFNPNRETKNLQKFFSENSTKELENNTRFKEIFEKYYQKSVLSRSVLTLLMKKPLNNYVFQENKNAILTIINANPELQTFFVEIVETFFTPTLVTINNTDKKALNFVKEFGIDVGYLDAKSLAAISRRSAEINTPSTEDKSEKSALFFGGRVQELSGGYSSKDIVQKSNNTPRPWEYEVVKPKFSFKSLFKKPFNFVKGLFKKKSEDKRPRKSWFRKAILAFSLAGILGGGIAYNSYKKNENSNNAEMSSLYKDSLKDKDENVEISENEGSLKEKIDVETVKNEENIQANTEKSTKASKKSILKRFKEGSKKLLAGIGFGARNAIGFVGKAAKDAKLAEEARLAEVRKKSNWKYTAKEVNKYGHRDNAMSLARNFRENTDFDALASQYPNLFGELLTPWADYRKDKFIGALIVMNHNEKHKLTRTIDQVYRTEYSLSLKDMFNRLITVRGGSHKNETFYRLLEEGRYAELNQLIASGKIRIRINLKEYARLKTMVEEGVYADAEEIPIGDKAALSLEKTEDGSSVVRLEFEEDEKLIGEDSIAIGEDVENAFAEIGADKLFVEFEGSEVDNAIDSVRNGIGESGKLSLKDRLALFKNKVNASLKNIESDKVPHDKRDPIYTEEMKREVMAFRNALGRKDGGGYEKPFLKDEVLGNIEIDLSQIRKAA